MFGPRNSKYYQGEGIAVRRTASAPSPIGRFVCVDPCDGSRQIVRAFARERVVLSPSEKTVLRTFRQFLVTPGRMLCFFGPNLEKHKTALQQLTKKDFLIKEDFKGAYSLTRAGYDAMKNCDQ